MEQRSSARRAGGMEGVGIGAGDGSEGIGEASQWLGGVWVAWRW